MRMSIWPGGAVDARGTRHQLRVTVTRYRATNGWPVSWLRAGCICGWRHDQDYIQTTSIEDRFAAHLAAYGLAREELE